jgi:predicted nucleic acid-binding protein
VATRPVACNGLGLSAALALEQVNIIERFLTVLPDSPMVYEEWKRLVVAHGVLGIKVHDPKLVATMNVHGVPRILTFDIGDFTRYDIKVIHPAALVS